MLGDAVFVALAAIDAGGAQTIVLQQGGVIGVKRPVAAALHLVGSCGGIVRARHLGDAAQGPERILPAVAAEPAILHLTMYHPVYLRARERNRIAAYRRERRRRQTIVEGFFASLHRLGWQRSRLRGLWKVNCEGYMAALAHNVLKMVRKLGCGVDPPDHASPAAGTVAGRGYSVADADMDVAKSPPSFSLLNRLVIYLQPVLL